MATRNDNEDQYEERSKKLIIQAEDNKGHKNRSKWNKSREGNLSQSLFPITAKKETSRAKNPTTTDGEELNAPEGGGGGAGDGDGAMLWWSWPS